MLLVRLDQGERDESDGRFFISTFWLKALYRRGYFRDLALDCRIIFKIHDEEIMWGICLD
jgi:hypothetical protein